jgi:hypothetical protein
LEEIAIKERQRANRLEEELISRSNRKSAQKSRGGSSHGSGEKVFVKRCENCLKLEKDTENLSRLTAGRLEEDYRKIQELTKKNEYLKDKCDEFKEHLRKVPDLKRYTAKLQIYERGLE